MITIARVKTKHIKTVIVPVYIVVVSQVIKQLKKHLRRLS